MLKRPCAFIVQAGDAGTLPGKIFAMLDERNVELSSLQLFVQSGHSITIILHCRLEKDKVRFLSEKFKKIAGIKKVEWLNDSTRNSGY